MFICDVAGNFILIGCVPLASYVSTRHSADAYSKMLPHPTPMVIPVVQTCSAPVVLSVPAQTAVLVYLYFLFQIIFSNALSSCNVLEAQPHVSLSCTKTGERTGSSGTSGLLGYITLLYVFTELVHLHQQYIPMNGEQPQRNCCVSQARVQAWRIWRRFSVCSLVPSP